MFYSHHQYPRRPTLSRHKHIMPARHEACSTIQISNRINRIFRFSGFPFNRLSLDIQQDMFYTIYLNEYGEIVVDEWNKSFDIRNEQELNRIRQYIKDNPENWHMDKMNHCSGNIVMEPVTPYAEEIWMM